MMVGSPSQNEAGEPSSSSSSTAPSPIPLRNLFHFSRFSLDRSLLYLLLWSPVGLVLACVRFLLALQFLIVGCFLPEALWNRGVLVRWILGLLGIAVRVDSDSLEWSSEKGRILISNHISPVDPLVIHSLTDSIAVSLWLEFE
ncbi:unnamed protein product [Cyprideis torosa]|uniref:Uncharacterized protein n=1 Tax=Cyprideis torosa TaxID=163714 RepID=A0A7R8ZMY0_9CRUS|nr:unnamed protein product [Cyprideis torosa]CAG0890143.1 unnamed protein product [Cyprideis torosa]